VTPTFAPASLPAAAVPPAAVASQPLAAIACGHRYRVLAIDGDDALAKRLVAAGLWPGVEVERLRHAPFGDPLLFRVHGFRIALRVSEAARVRVVASS
jgi:ferrous iron transport protein A